MTIRKMKSLFNFFTMLIAAASANQGSSDQLLRGRRRRLKTMCSNVFVRFEIVDARTNKTISTLQNGDTINLSTLGISNAQQLNIKAVTCGSGIDAVSFIVDDTYYQYVERQQDDFYMLCGNTGSDLYTCPFLTLGHHSLAVSAHGSKNTDIGSVRVLSFTIVQPKTTISSASSSAKRELLFFSTCPLPPMFRFLCVLLGSPISTIPPAAGPSAPTPAPRPTCRSPKLVGEWKDYPQYPFNVLESHGGMIGKDFVILSGFKTQFDQTTLETYALDTTNSTATWRRMDDAPLSVAPGFSHSAYAIVGTKVYLCGGYLGPTPGRDFSNCVVYDHSITPGSGKQWSSIASLPDGRGGAGMIYDKKRHALYFASGADRAQGTTHSYDKADTWMYDLNKPELGWVKKVDIPFQANHMSAVTAKDAYGNDRHFFLGGQTGEDEANGNTAKHYEWDAVTETWIAKADIPSPRGHFSSSTRAVGCGFLIAGGTSNGTGKISDITFYDIQSNQWTKIGDLWDKMNTPICDIAKYSNGEMWLYCDGHWYGKKRIQITF